MLKQIRNKCGIGVLILLIIALSIVGCGNKGSNEIYSGDFGISLEQYNYSIKKPSKERLIEIADGLMENKLTVYYEMESMEYDFENLDWNVKYTQSPASFQLYLQCLNPVAYLTEAYQQTNNEHYLERAEEFILSWDKYSKNEELTKGNNKVWYDHGTALRADNVILYALVSEKAGLLKDDVRKVIIKLLKEHGERLADSNFYTENHNHGIFQDQALIYIAFFLNNEDKDNWIELAKQRLSTQIDFAFTDEMIHIENSPGYQIGVTDLFRVIAEFLIEFDDKFGQELYEKIQASTEFMGYITKPNGAVAAIGDTSDVESGSTTSDAKAEAFENNVYTYAATRGEKGNMPTKTSKFYPLTGYYISHNSWEKEDYVNSTWMMFKSGYLSKTHKHADDNSFMLYSKGHDIFVDTGWYNYSTGDKYRDYFVSAAGHNTVIVDGKTYSPTDENSYKTGIFDYGTEDGYEYVRGFNDEYNGVMMDRSFYNLGDAIIIHDNIVSESEHMYSQVFQTSEVMELIAQEKNELLFKLGDTGYRVRIKQLQGDPVAKVTKGNLNDDNVMGLISRKMNQLDTINTIVFEQQGSNIDFITMITIENENGDIKDINSIDYEQQTRTFNILGEKQYSIQMTTRPRITMDSIDIQRNDNKYTFINNCVGNENTYAWYIIDRKSNKAIEKTEYSTDNSFTYEFSNNGEFLVRGYIRNKNQRKQAIVSVIKYDAQTKQAIELSDEYPCLDLVYSGQSIEKVSDNIYRFSVEYDYSLESSIKWYIYKDGSYFDLKSTNSTEESFNCLEYQFTEPGDYTVMYYITTSQGNNEFWNYPMVSIK